MKRIVFVAFSSNHNIRPPDGQINIFYMQPQLIFSCDQAALCMVQSVRLSVCLSVTPIFTMFPSSYLHKTFTNYYQWQKWCPCKRWTSEVKGQDTEVMTQLSRFRTVTRVWVHILWWNDAQSFMLLRRGATLFFNIICQFSRSHN